MDLKRLDTMSDDALTSEDYFWALKDVSFTVKRGETVGLIGANGAGKTTTLSLLAGITQPSRGDIHIAGRMAALIQLGAGFHPELTGRENVFLSASIMGLSHEEVAERYDEIVAFAELEAFMDTPVKRYSSGMYARLGFSIAAHIRPDVLLVDEVLAVGDLAFRTKCYRHMTQLADQDRAVIMVSHTMSAVHALCDRVIWLDKGQIRMEDDSLTVIAAYTDWMREHGAEPAGRQKWSGRGGVEELRVKEVQVLAADETPVTEIEHGQPLIIDLIWEATRAFDRVAFELIILDASTGTTVNLIRPQPEDLRPIQPGIGRARFVLPEVLFMPRRYQIGFSLRDAQGYPLVWVNTAIGPQGGGVLSPSKLDTEVALYSTKEGQEHKRVYHGRLRDLRWNPIVVDNPRLLIGDIPTPLIESDPERDSPLGVIEVTLKTPKQGNFFTRQENVQIYKW